MEVLVFFAHGICFDVLTCLCESFSLSFYAGVIIGFPFLIWFLEPGERSRLFVSNAVFGIVVVNFFSVAFSSVTFIFCLSVITRT